MLRVVSVSLGTTRRDFREELDLPQAKVVMERIGCQGDLSLAAQILSSLDGQVAALGLGGANFYYHLGNRRIPCPAGRHLVCRVSKTPLVDGSGWKQFIEPLAVEVLQGYGISLAGKTALVVSVLDRYWLAESLSLAGCKVLAGDALFGLRLPCVLPLSLFTKIAHLTLPFLARLPLHFLYPLGPAQEKPGRIYSPSIPQVDIIAGNWHFICRYLLPYLSKSEILITCGTNKEDLRLLKQVGVKYLLSTTPLWKAGSPSANAVEAVLMALGAKKEEPTTYIKLARELRWLPKLIELTTIE
ncbi:MAG: hypothetical protein L5656_02095 [Thermanaeromonas sp.]|uniref:hypothetical protein n=1 Tax=Thermanaeromonas sp. TaxID=2003697 RepID=UPI00243DE14D|nr:hypothetical protein [Thermanaeromonas sp.]MCG0277314.1 hypothetical protein [Thermanaeromonas sp.]